MYHIIINPASRSGKGLTIWKEELEPALDKGPHEYTAYFSKNVNDIERLVREIEASSSEDTVKILVLGGDGSMNEALQGITDFNRVVLGYVPTGSSNDLARDLGLRNNISKLLLDILDNPCIIPTDIGEVSFDDGYTNRFAVSCGIGYDAAVCENILHSTMKSTLNKLGLGKLTYLGIALKLLIASKYTSAVLSFENKTIPIDKFIFATGMIHRYEGGGFMFCPEADCHDGLLDICVASSIPKPQILVALPTAFKGKHYRFNGINAYRTKEYLIESAIPLWVHTDGEVRRCTNRLRVKCLENKLLFLTTNYCK